MKRKVGRVNKILSNWWSWLVNPDDGEDAAWSRKRRLGVATIGTLGVLALAFGIGGGLYKTGVVLGVVDDTSLRQKVLERVMDDTLLVAAVHQEAVKNMCQIETAGVKFSFSPPMREMALPGFNRCEVFYLPGGGTDDSQVTISTQLASTDVVIAGLVNRFSDVATKQVTHPHFSLWTIYGQVAQTARKVYVLELNSEKSMVIEYFRADPVHEIYVDRMIMSMQPL